MTTFIQCKQCSNYTPKSAKTCSTCGAKASMSTGAKFALWFFGGMVALSFIGANVETTPEQRAAWSAERQREQLATAGAQTLRGMMRDPDSFQLISALVAEKSGAACFQYRSRNGFGGMGVGAALAYGSKVYTAKAGEDYPLLWNDLCTGGKAYDVTAHVKMYL